NFSSFKRIWPDERPNHILDFGGWRNRNLQCGLGEAGIRGDCPQSCYRDKSDCGADLSFGRTNRRFPGWLRLQTLGRRLRTRASHSELLRSPPKRSLNGAPGKSTSPQVVDKRECRSKKSE